MIDAEVLIERAKRLGHSGVVAAWAVELVTKRRTICLCIWCAEQYDPGHAAEDYSMRGECSRCPYVGPDCVVFLDADRFGVDS